MNKYGKFQINLLDSDDIQINEGAENEEYMTVALFGGDSREGALDKGTHADTIIIVSINNKTRELRMVSVYRDLLTKQIDGEYKKANSAYFIGGAKEAINMLNKNYDLAIQDYVTVDFQVVADVVDLLGGVEINVTEEEAEEMNRHIVGTALIVGKEAEMMEGGLQVLDGVKAVTYSRIRKNVGGDYERTERQRMIINELVRKVKSTDIGTVNEIIDTVFSKIATSFTLKEILKLAAGFLQYELDDSRSFAFEYTDGTIEGIGSVVIPLGVTENVQELHAFLYPGETYTPSETVKEIASEIEGITGKTRADYVEQNPPQTSDE